MSEAVIVSVVCTSIGRTNMAETHRLEPAFIKAGGVTHWQLQPAERRRLRYGLDIRKKWL